MRFRIRPCIILLAVLALPALLAHGQVRPGGPVNLQANVATPYMPGEVLVGYKPNVTLAQRAGARGAVGATVLQDFSRIGVEHWKLPAGMNVPAALRLLKRNENLRFVEPNYEVSIGILPNDPFLDQPDPVHGETLWGLHNTGQAGGTPDADIDAPEAWDISTGSSQVVVGVIDTGVDYTHEDLAANIWTNPGEIANNGIDDDGNGYVDDIHGYDFYNNDPDPRDDHYHGTHVAGTIGAVGDNGIGVVGVAWNVKIMALKFLSSSGSGFTSDAVAAVDYATDMRINRGVNVVLTSNSWGGGGFSSALESAIQAAGNAGMLFVAAAGNSNSNNDSSPHYPSNYNLPNIISVAATDRNDNKASFSSYGANTVDLGAPGVDTLSTIPPEASGGLSAYWPLQGTSMATPHVSGVAAMAWSLNPSAGYAAIKQAILDGVDPIPSMAGITVTGGRLNAFNTIAGSGGNIPPVADAGSDISASDGDGSGAETVTLDGSASYDPDGSIVGYTWDEGGTTIGAGASIIADFSVGVHTVTLTVEDDGAATSSDTVIVTVGANQAPIADAGPNQSVSDSNGDGFELVTLDGSASADADGSIVAYDWSEGAVALGSGPVLDVTFASGTHDVTLTVTDNGGAIGTDALVVTVGANQAPTADAGPDQTVTDLDDNGSELVTLDGSASSDADGSVVAYEWSEAGTILGPGAVLSVDLAVGVHTITLTVTDDGGAAGSDTVVVTVLAAGSVPTSIAFDGFESDSFDGGAGAWVGPWIKNGDVKVRTGRDNPHSGNSHVRMRKGGATLLRAVDLSGASNVHLTFWARVRAFESNDQMLVRVSPDGSSFTSVMVFTSADSDNVYHPFDIDLSSFAVTANFQILFEGQMNDKNDFFYLDDVELTGLTGPPGNQPPVADAGGNLNASDPDGSGEEIVTLDGSASFDPDGSIVSYLWTEGGSTLGSGAILNVSFPVGAHSVTLTVQDDAGDSSSDTIQVTVDPNQAPTADAGGNLNASDPDGSGDEILTLDGSASSDADGSIVLYEWFEGGALLGTGAALDVSFAVGSYSVTLIVTDNGGASSSDTIQVTVDPNQPPTADAGPDQTVVDANDDGFELVSLDGSGSSDPDGSIASYEWSEAGNPLGTGAAIDVSFPVGAHTVTLTVTDNGGASHSNSAVITVVAPGGGAPTTIAFDGFESDSFDGGSGAWVGPWIKSGDVKVRTGRDHPHSGNSHVRMRKGGASLERVVDLSGSAGVHLTFWARVKKFEGSDEMRVRVSADGSSFTTVAVFTAADSDDTYHFYDIDLSSFPASGGFTILFDGQMNDKKDFFYLDDVEITGVQ